MNLLDALIKLPIALFILFGCAVLFMVLYKWFRNIWVKIGAFLLLFAYGVVVFMMDPSVNKEPTCALCKSVLAPNTIKDQACALDNIIAAVNNTISMFFPSRGGNDFSQPSSQFFYLLTHVYAALLVLSLFARRPMNRCLGLLHVFLAVRRRNRKRYVFFGGGEPARLLAKDVLTTKTAVCEFYLDKRLDDNKKLFDELDEMGATVIYENLDDAKACQSCVKKRSIFPFRSSYFFLDDNDDFNVRIAMSILDALKEKTPQDKAHLHIRTETEGTLFDKTNGRVEVHVFNQSDLTARHFVDDHPMHKCPGIGVKTAQFKVEGEFKLLLLGFGWTGREVLNKCICDAQFKDCDFRATIIERGYETQYGYYPVLFNECMAQYNMQFNPDGMCDVNSEKFCEWFQKETPEHNRIIVTLGNDKTNIEVAGLLAQFLIEKGKTAAECREIIFAHVRQNKKYGYYESHTKVPFAIFGKIEKIYTQAIVINEFEDQIAKMVNYVYNLKDYDNVIETIPVNKEDGEREDEKTWRETSLFDKNSSRAVALSLRNFIRRHNDGNLDALTLGELRLTANAISNRIPEKEIRDLLAYNEHLRWNAFLFTNGVRFLPLDGIKAVIENEKPRIKQKLCDDNDVPYKHACLVRFEELDNVSKCVNDLWRDKHGVEFDEFGQVSKCANELWRDKLKTLKKSDFAKTDHHIVRHFPLFIRESKRKES